VFGVLVVEAAAGVPLRLADPAGVGLGRDDVAESFSRLEQVDNRSMTSLMTELLSASQIGPHSTRMSAASTRR